MAIDYDEGYEPEMPPEHTTLDDRVRLLERDTRAHARSLTEIVKTLASHGDDLKKLGEWQMSRLIAEAREEERDKSLKERLDRIDTSIGDLMQALKASAEARRAFWMQVAKIAATPIILAAVSGIAYVLVKGVTIAAGHG